MKNINKIIMFILVLCMFFVSTDVYAGNYSLKELVPISDQDANVFSSTFNYSGIKFETSSEGKVNGVLKFKGIHNNTSARKTPSFNILLFDGSKKNIGYITYCAEKDYGSDNSLFYIPGKETKPFQIKVTTRYFGGNDESFKGMVHEPGEILYYSFFSDNSYCQIGGYTKYLGLTIEEIISGEVNTGDKEVKEKLSMNELILYLPYLLIGLVGLVGYGLLLNILYKRMHARSSILSYLPMTNFYIAVKLAFGKKLAWVFYILCLISLYIAYSSSSMVFTYLLFGILGIATIIDIIKLITGKYDMFVIGGSKHTSGDSFEDTFATNSSSRFIDDGTEIKEKEEELEQPITTNDFLNSIDNGINDKSQTETSLIDSNDVVDISYATDVPISEDGFTSIGVDNNLSFSNNMNTDLNNNMNSDTNNEPVSFFGGNTLTPVSNVANTTDTLSDDNNSNVPKLEDESSGESELSNFFR